MPDNTPRREFLKTSIKGSIAVGLGISALPGVLESCNPVRKATASTFNTGFDQQPLPYSYDALENVIDARTMDIHYTKHAAAYAKNLKDAAQAENIDMKKPLEDVLLNVSKYSAKV